MRPRHVLMACCAAGISTAPPALAQDSDSEIAELRARIAALEARSQHPLSFGSLGGTEITLYGYVKADFIQDFDSDLGTTIFGIATLEPGMETGKNFRAHAFQSRLGIDVTTPTSIGDVKAKVEGDFFGGGGGTFRLRHAYVSFGGWTVGQTWTTFMPIESYSSTVDFQGPAGIPFARQTQARYTFEFGQGAKAAIAVENASGASSDPVGVLALSYGTDRFFAKVAGIFGTVEDGPVEVDRWGFNVSGNARLWDGGSVMVSYTEGEAIDSYFVFGGDDIRGGAASRSRGATVGISQDIGDKVTLGIAYGWRELDDPAPDETGSLETVHASIFWHPTERLTVAAEGIWGERELGDGSTVDASRLQTSVQFNF